MPSPTPTALNLDVLRSHFAGADRAKNRMHSTHMSHIRRCFKAGLFTIEGDELVLTDEGKTMLVEGAPKRTRKARAKTPAHTVAVGAIFCESWGYEQTNINFYEVVRTTKTQVIVRELHSARVDTDGPNARTFRMMPVAGSYKGSEQLRRKVSTCDYGTYIEIRSYGSCKLWDGEPAVETNSVFGH